MQLPASVGKYELLEFLGGGMSHVYRARDTVIDRPVVVKMLTLEACSDAEAKARFLQEARLAGNIQHENIVSVFDFGEHEGRPYIVMEYLKGEDLRGAIREGHTGSIFDRVRIALQVAEALGYVNALGIVHRDIKPENIHIDAKGKVKLMDFGIAKTADLSLTRTGMAMGTPYYMSPEQVAGKPTTTLMDVYAYGMLLFELLTGERAVKGDTMEAVFYQILSVPVDIAAMENAGVPAPLRDLVLHCTVKNAAERAQGFPEIVTTLRGILAGGEGDGTREVPLPTQRAATPPGSPPSAPVRPEVSPRKSMVRLSLVTYGLVTLVTIIAVYTWIHLRPPEQIPGMVYIPGGAFQAGEDRHMETLKPFYIDETEVTNAQFATFCRGPGAASGCVISAAASDMPVVNVSYALAREYAKSQGERLPTPLEWERAARGAAGDAYPWGKSEDPLLANVANNRTLPVKQLMPARSFNPYRGLYQMVGNAWEMVEGEVMPSPAAVAQFANLNPPATASEPWIEIRGGDFLTPLSPRILFDSSSIPERFTGPNIGFRCVKDP